MAARKQPSPAADLGTLLVGCVLVCGAAGYVLDGQFNTKPWLLIGGLLLGFCAWLWQAWKTLGRK